MQYTAWDISERYVVSIKDRLLLHAQNKGMESKTPRTKLGKYKFPIRKRNPKFQKISKSTKYKKCQDMNPAHLREQIVRQSKRKRRKNTTNSRMNKLFQIDIK